MERNSVKLKKMAKWSTNDRYRFVHAKSFNIKLIDGKNNVADEIGNLDGRARTNDVAKWEYPEGLTLERWL